MALLQNPKSLSCDSVFGACQRLNQVYFSTKVPLVLRVLLSYGSCGSSDKSALRSLDLLHNSLLLCILLKTGNLPSNSITGSEQDSQVWNVLLPELKEAWQTLCFFLRASWKVAILWKGCPSMSNITAPLKMLLMHWAPWQGLCPTIWSTCVFKNT